MRFVRTINTSLYFILNVSIDCSQLSMKGGNGWLLREAIFCMMKLFICCASKLDSIGGGGM